MFSVIRWLSQHWLEASQPVETEEGVLVSSTIRDVTGRKRVEEKIRQSEAELRQLIDVIPQQVYVFDPDWSPLFANERDREYTGFMLKEGAV